jgi:hypothetical protein
MGLNPTKPKGVFGEYKGYQLLESQIRYAMSNTTSNAEAAKWLHVSFATWKKYAKMYIDAATGKTLYDLHKENGMAKRLVLPQTRYRRKASAPWAFQPIPIDEIFANKHPKYNLRSFKERLIKEGWISERCSCCGYQERRQYDYEVPLKLHWIDGNKQNYALENIQLLCFNCYFIHVGNPWGAEKQYYIDEATGEPVPIKGDRKSLKDQVIKTGPYFQERLHNINKKKGS